MGLHQELLGEVQRRLEKRRRKTRASAGWDLEVWKEATVVRSLKKADKECEVYIDRQTYIYLEIEREEALGLLRKFWMLILESFSIF